MPDYRRRNCARSPRGCGKHESEVGPISWQGLCENCGRTRMNENVDQMEARTGPNFTLWRRQMVASAYPELLDVLDGRL